MNSFHFLRPYGLLAFIPLVWLCWIQFRSVRKGGSWSRLCDEALLPHLIISKAKFKSTHVWMLYALAGSLAILALAGPVWERLPVPVFRNDSALIIALDLSRSMDAKDIKPSRLDRARFKIEDLLNQRKDGLTALLVYSGDAFTVTPLTDDVETIKSQLKSLSTDLMPAQGSRADLAFDLAKRLFEQAGLTHGDVLLISAGVNLTHGEPQVKKLKQSGFRVSVLGAGSEEGAPVPLPQGGFLQDTQGNIIVSKLASPALKLLASDGGGVYRTISSDHSDITDLTAFFDSLFQRDAKATADDIQIDQWLETGPYLLLVLLPLAAIAFRRGYWIVWLVLIMPLAKPAHAFDWQTIWKNSDQKAAQAFASGDVQRAAVLFDRSDWKAAAQYRSGQYEKAVKTLEPVDSADAHYNRGNALAKLNRYPEALAAYEQALKSNPKHEDALYNKALIEKAMKDDQQQPKDDRQQDKDKSQDSDKGEKSDQNSDKGDKDQDGKPDEAQSDQASKASDQPSEKNEQTKQAESKGPDESNQADEQWLRRIPDDPGGLLRRKFLYQYNQRQGARP